jgi:FKBP-type peptidyl-prolyl cis-trans isomerase FkpA
MKKFIYSLLLAPVILSSCGESFKKTKGGGMEYKIIKSGKGDLLKYGNFIEFSFRQTYKDSVLATSADYSNQIAVLDSASIPVDIYKIFSQCRVGDSIVLKTVTDSAFRDPQTGQLMLPPGIKKGQFIYTGYKIANAYATRVEADSMYKILTAQGQERAKLKEKGQLVKDDKTISDYLAKNKIVAEKAPEGTYVQIITPGTGNKIDTSVLVKVNYTGKTMAGKTFDSNTDPAFQHVEPYPVPMWTQQGLIKGWFDGLSLLQKGSKAKFYVPSPLGYGSQSKGADIGPNEIMVFDIEVIDVVSKEVAMAEAKVQQEEQQKQQQKMAVMQQRYQDSLSRAAKMDSLKKK